MADKSARETTDLVEKCARALCAHDGDHDQLPTEGYWRKHYMDAALAVIDALADGVTKLHPLDPAVDAALDKLLPWIGLDAHDANAKVVAVRDAVVVATQSFLSAAIRAAQGDAKP